MISEDPEGLEEPQSKGHNKMEAPPVEALEKIRKASIHGEAPESDGKLVSNEKE
jgi:hypothetical protein